MSELVLLRPWWLLAIPLLLIVTLLIWRRGTDAIVIAIDMSPSVTQGTALSDAQAAAARILTHTGGRPVGLILYTDRAYEVAAPTSDPATLESQIAVLSKDTMPDKGSRPASALGIAADILSGLKRADMIVISDGGGIDEAALAEAARLKANGVRISALILNRTAPGAPPSDETALRRIANGAVAPSHSPEPVLAGVTTYGAYTKDKTLNVLQFVDYGPYLTGLALLAYLMLFRRQA